MFFTIPRTERNVSYTHLDVYKRQVMLQYRCALKALESRVEILNEEFSLQHDRNPIESMKSRLKSPSSICLLYTSRCV